MTISYAVQSAISNCKKWMKHDKVWLPSWQKLITFPCASIKEGDGKLKTRDSEQLSTDEWSYLTQESHFQLRSNLHQIHFILKCRIFSIGYSPTVSSRLRNSSCLSKHLKNAFCFNSLQLGVKSNVEPRSRSVRQMTTLSLAQKIVKKSQKEDHAKRIKIQPWRAGGQNDGLHKREELMKDRRNCRTEKSSTWLYSFLPKKCSWGDGSQPVSNWALVSAEEQGTNGTV